MNTKNKKQSIPDGWVLTTIGEVFSLAISGSGFPKVYQGNSSGQYPFAKVGDISRRFRSGEKYIEEAQHYIDENVRQKIKAKIFPEASIVFPKIGEALKGNYRLISKGEMLFDNNVMGVVCADGVLVDFLYYFLTTQDFGKFSVATTVPSIRRGDIELIQLSLPPSNEQHRIVAKIEELFSELDKGIESLKTAREQLKVYRQALLKHAFEGKLTEQWRAEQGCSSVARGQESEATKDNADNLEAADQLLERIKLEREARYQQQLEDWKAAVKQWEADGKEWRKPGKPVKLKEMDEISNDELALLPVVPESWIWIKYGDLCSKVRNGISKKPVGEEGEKIFRISAVRPMHFKMDDYRIIQNQDGEFDAYYLSKGDLVFTRYNGSRRYVGVCANYKSDEKRLFPDKLIQTRPDLPSLSASFLEKGLNSGGSRKFIESKIRTTAGQSGVSGGDIKNIPVPVCSMREQQEIVEQLESTLSILDENEKVIDFSLSKSEALRQSILKKAFSGQLVPQDSNDEPATVLLDRIAAEKVEAATKSKKAVVKKTKTRLKSNQVHANA